MSYLNISSQEINLCEFNLKPDKNKNLLIHVVTACAGSIEQNGVKFEFEPGDITYRNAGIPSIVSFEEPTRLIALRLPANRLIGYVNTNEFNHPRQLKSDLVLFHLIHNLTDFFLQNDEEISSFHLPAIEQSLNIMFGSAYVAASSRLDERLHIANATRWKQLDALIKTKICDSQLSPAYCAEMLGISERYIYKLFEARGEKFSRHALNNRLDLAKTMLENNNFLTKDISSIAFQCGFNSLAHFSRSFKNRFDVSPVAFRNIILK